MTPKHLFILLVCIAVTLTVVADLRAGPIVFCSGGSPDYVNSYTRSADNGRHPASATVLWNPLGLSALTDSAFRPTTRVGNWLCDSGDVRVLTAGEITTRDAANDTAQTAATRTAASDAVNEDRELRAMMQALLDEVNALRSRSSLAALTYKQIRDAARAKIAAGDLDEAGS